METEAVIVGDKYRVRELIGEGNMGSVYEAEHVHTRRRCALKVLSDIELVQSDEALGRFAREAQAAGVISSRHIAQVFDAGLDEASGMPFIVMELLEGEDLHELLTRLGPLPPELALRIAAQASLGLQKAHEAKVVHRDVKPHNLFLCLEDAGEVVVKLLDFGVAKIKKDQASTMAGAALTAPGSLLGSPRYMSPEQARGSTDLDSRTDIWSLGAVLYQCLCGHSPYHQAQNLAALLVELCGQPPPALREQAPWVDEATAEVVHRCLQLDVAERYGSAQELFDAIAPLVDRSWSIHRDMLVSLDDEARSVAAVSAAETAPAEPEAAESSPGPAAEPPANGDATLRSAGALAPVPAEERPAAIDGTLRSAGEPAAAAIEQPPRPGKPSSAGRWALVALGLAAAAAVALLVLRQGDSDSAPAPPTAGAATSAASPPSSHEATRSTATAARRVRVVILPADAAVEVEGKPTTAPDGILVLDGTLGDVFRVRVHQDDSETTADVVISHSGALPPKIELVPGKIVRMPSPHAAGQPPSAPPATAAAVATAAPSPKSTAKPKAPLDSNVSEFE